MKPAKAISQTSTNWAWPTHTSIDQTESYLNETAATSTNGNLDSVIVLPAPRSLGLSPTVVGIDKVIGTAGIWDEATGEIGLMLHRDCWGQGYMSEVLTTLVPRFWERGFKRLVADVDPRKGGSIKVLNRFGSLETHREKNTFKTDIGWCDSVYLELSAPRRFGQ